MLVPSLVSRGRDILVAHRAAIGGFGRLTDKTSLFGCVLVEDRAVNGFMTAGTFFELRVLLTLLKKMLVESLYLDYLVAILALCEHRTVLPEVEVHSFAIPKCWITLTAELALAFLLALSSWRSESDTAFLILDN